MSNELNTEQWLMLFGEYDVAPWSFLLSIRARQGSDTCSQTLQVVVARLLVIALKVMNWRDPQGQTAALPVPRHYRRWPMMESEPESHRSCRRMQFYISAKAAMLLDGRSFPVGTTLVVDSHRVASKRASVKESLVARFVLGKYASVMSGKSDQAERGAWRFTTYGPEGEPVFSGCRVLSCAPRVPHGSGR